MSSDVTSAQEKESSEEEPQAGRSPLASTREKEESLENVLSDNAKKT